MKFESFVRSKCSQDYQNSIFFFSGLGGGGRILGSLPCTALAEVFGMDMRTH